MNNILTLELPRKGFHILFGIGYLTMYLLLGYTLLFWLFSGVLFTINIIAMKLANNPKWNKLFRSAIRKDSPLKGVGSLVYLIAAFITCSLEHYTKIETEILVYAIITLSVGDGLATIVGKASKTFMRSELFSKSYFGSIIGAIVSVLVILLICELFYFNQNIGHILGYVVLGMTIEFLLGWKYINKIANGYCLDNILIPLGIVIVSIVL